MSFRCVLPKGTPWKKERQEAGDGLLLFPRLSFSWPKLNDMIPGSQVQKHEKGSQIRADFECL